MGECQKHQSWNQIAKVRFPNLPQTFCATLAASQKVGSPSNPPPCLTNEALRAQRDEVTCPGSPRSMCGKAGVGSQAPGIQFSPLPSSAYSISLEGSLYSFAVCTCTQVCVVCMCMHAHTCACVCVFSWAFSRNHVTAEQPAQLLKSHFVRIRLWVSLYNPTPPTNRGLVVAGQGAEMGNICLVFNVWCLYLALPSFYYIDDRQAQATEKKQIT